MIPGLIQCGVASVEDAQLASAQFIGYLDISLKVESVLGVPDADFDPAHDL